MSDRLQTMKTEVILGNAHIDKLVEEVVSVHKKEGDEEMTASAVSWLRRELVKILQKEVVLSNWEESLKKREARLRSSQN